MARILCFAASQFAFFPVMTIISELLFSAGRSILVLVSSRIWGETKTFIRQSAFLLIWAILSSKRSYIPSLYLLHLCQLCFCEIAWKLGQRLNSCSQPGKTTVSDCLLCYDIVEFTNHHYNLVYKLKKPAYHFSHYFLHELCAFLHFSTRSTQLYNVTFLCRVREIDDNL